MYFYETLLILLSFCRHLKGVNNVFAKYSRTTFFAHMGYAVALTADRNKIVFHSVKSSLKM